jgi:predicted metalloenzyme YecM
MPTHPIIGDYESFLTALLDRMRLAGIDLAGLPVIDHVAYRVETEERYAELKEALAGIATLASEETINGRPICIFRLDEPLRCQGYEIPAVELPAPSATPYPEGLEHAEFVIPDIARFMERYSRLAFITKDLGQPANPHVAVQFGSLAAKFHTRSILEVVVLQKASR